MPSFAIAAAWRVFSVVSSVAANLLTIRLCARTPEQLPPGAFGLVQISLLLLGFLPLVDGGFRMAINRQLLAGSDDEQRRRFLNFGQRLYLYLTGVALLVAVGALGAYSLLRAPSPQAIAPGWFVAMGAAGALAFAAQAQASLLVGLGQQWRTFAVTSLTAWLNLAAVAFGLSAHWGLWSFPAAIAASAAITFLASWVQVMLFADGVSFLGSLPHGQFPATFRELRSTSLSAFKNQLCTAALYSADPILVDLLSRNPHDTDRYAVTARVYILVRNLLQSPDEALWPKIAQDRARGTHISKALSQLNGWIHGATGAALFFTLPPFIESYARPEWSPSLSMMALFSARNLITGLCSQPAYFLYGDGRFDVLGRGMQHELLAAVVISIPLGLAYGGIGVAIAFLAATLAGTFLPIPRAYSLAVEWPFPAFFRAVWVRAASAALVSAAASAFLAPQAKSTVSWVIVGGVVSLLGLLPAWPVDLKRQWRGILSAK